MCVICKDLDKLSEIHINEIVRGMRPERIRSELSDINKAIMYYQAYTIGDFCDGFEEQAVKASLERLQTAKKVLSRHL